MSSSWLPRKRKEFSPWLVAAALLFSAGTIFLPRVGWDPWILGSLAVACGIGAIYTTFLKEKAKAKDSSDILRRQSARTIGRKSVLPLPKDIPLSAWGVHESRVAVTYLHRDAEADVKNVLEQQQPVLILGPSMAGKTRMASHLVQELFSTYQVFIPDVPDGVANVMNAGEMPRKTVVWLNDLERYLEDPKNLKAKWVEDLKNNENIVVATMRSTFYESFMPSEERPRTQWEILHCFQKVHLNDTSSESLKLAALSDNTQVSKGILAYGLGTYIGGGFLAVERLEAGRSNSPVGRALVMAAVDWQRSGMGDVIPETTARALIRPYIDNVYPQLSSDEIEAGLEWATAKVVSGDLFGLLARTEDGSLRPFDYLVDHIAATGVPIPPQLWQAAVQSETPANRLNNAGTTAALAGHDAIATEFFERAAVMGDPEAMANLGTTRERQDRIAEAKMWHTRAAEAGNPHGMTGLGVMLLREGRMEEAEKLLKRAAEAGNGDAMTNLGVILLRRGETDDGIEWHRRAAAAGSGMGMTNYGMQLEQQGDTAAAEALYRNAIGRRNGAGMFQMAMLLTKQGKIDEVEPLLREAVKQGNPSAMAWLGSILAVRGNHDEADLLYQRAAERDEALGLAMVAKRQTELGKYDEAEKLFKRSAAHGLTFALQGLGVLYARTDRIDEAKAQYRLAIADGDLQSMLNLGALLTDEGGLTEAQALFRKAANLGSAEGMYRLSQSLLLGGKAGDAKEAATFLHKASVLGNLNAITELGKRAADQGDYARAFELLGKAAEMGDKHAAKCLALLQAQRTENNH